LPGERFRRKLRTRGSRHPGDVFGDPPGFAQSHTRRCAGQSNTRDRELQAGLNNRTRQRASRFNLLTRRQRLARDDRFC
jgi:hypothetical protein